MKLNILFDARHISNEFSGLGRYSAHVLEGLIKSPNLYNDIVVILQEHIEISNSLYQKVLMLINPNPSIRIVYVDYDVFSFGHYFKLGSYLNSNYSGFIYFYPHFDKPFHIRIKSIFVIHDLFPLVVKGYIVKNSFLKKCLFYLLCSISLYNKNSTCIAISMSTKNDILSWFSKFRRCKLKVVLSSDCLNQNLLHSYRPIINTALLDKKPYLFYIGDRRPHKNIKRMLDVFNKLKNLYGYNGYFLIAGSEKNFDIDFDQYTKNIPDVKFIGKVSDEELINYYLNMDSLFFLSKYEGFGLPVLEAAKLNQKIICSNISSLPEVAPNTALLVDLYKSDIEIAKDISLYISDQSEIDNSSFVKNFSWRITVKNIFSEL